LFYYDQPQTIWLKGKWLCDLGTVWGIQEGFLVVPAVPVLFFVGGCGYFLGLRTFTRRDLPAPL
jgi:ABC-2 type transport system permease protein